MYLCHNIKSALIFVNKILKYYILLILATVALVGCTTEPDSSATESKAGTSYSAIEAHYLDSYTQNIELHLPRQSSGISNSFRAQNIVKKSNYEHKNNFKFVKGGKVINVHINYFIQQKHFKNRHRFAKPSLSLVGLGRLII